MIDFGSRRNVPSNSNEWRQLTRRHFRQIYRRSDEEHAALSSVIALTFRPGDRTGHFLDKAIRPIGAAVLVALSYASDSVGPDNVRRRLHLSGFRANVASDGFVQYGGAAGSEFRYDGAMRPFSGAKGAVLDPSRNPSLVDLLNRMDKSCRDSFGRPKPCPSFPRFPQILLTFAPSRPPEFEDTPALRRLAAKELGVSVARLSANGPELLDMLLRDVWESRVIPPDAPGNCTGAVLISADLCTERSDFLKVYEDFSHLLGIESWNPAREVAPFQAPNPAQHILAKFSIDTSQNFNQCLEAGLIEELERAMRHELASTAELFSREEILDGVTSPDAPLSAWTKALPKLRSKLTSYVNECTTDDDLLRAARQPEKALFVRGACKIQVLERCSLDDRAALHFAPDELGRRIDADLFVESSGRSSCESAISPAAAIA
jgi:hypothetical protein